MKRKANDCHIDSSLVSKRSANMITPTPSNSNLVMTKTSKVTKTKLSKKTKTKETSIINPIANKNLKKITDDENKKIKAINGLQNKSREIQDQILDMLLKKNIELIDLECCIEEYKESLSLLENFPNSFQESRITSNANIQYLDEQLKKANDLINNLHSKNSNLEIMLKLRDEEARGYEQTVIIIKIVFRIHKETR